MSKKQKLINRLSSRPKDFTYEYKGYYSYPKYNTHDNMFWGKLEGINDSISFEGTTENELKAAFVEAVDDYLDTCQRNEMTPKLPFQGCFEIIIEPEIHKKVVLCAANQEISLNQVIETALKGYLASVD